MSSSLRSTPLLLAALLWACGGGAMDASDAGASGDVFPIADGGPGVDDVAAVPDSDVANSRRPEPDVVTYPDGVPGGDGVESIGAVEAWVEPNDTSPLAAWIHVETETPVTVSVEAWRGDVTDWEATSDQEGTSHRLAVIGLRPGTAYDFSVQLWSGGELVASPAALTFTTGLLAATFPPITISTHDPDRAAGGVTLFGLQSREDDVDTSWPLYLGVDASGVPIWSYQDAALSHDFVAREVSLLDDGNLLMLLDEGVRIITSAGDTVHEWLEVDVAGGGFHHEAIVLPSGNLVTLGFEQRDVDVLSLGGVVDVRGDTLREIDPQGAVVWTWNAFDHLDASVFPGPLSRKPHKNGYYDWTHANAIAHEPETETLLVSLRHQNQVIRIDRSSGEVLDRIGDGGDHTLLSGGWFYSQHSPEPAADGSLLVYDNGNERPDAVNGGILPKAERFSRAVIYAVDSEAKTASEVWSYTVPEFTMFVGDADRLTNGNVFVCAGGLRGSSNSGLARLHEVTPEMPAELVWALEVEGVVYRATRLSSLPH